MPVGDRAAHFWRPRLLSSFLTKAACSGEPEDLFLSKRDNDVFEDAGPFVVALLRVQIDRFRGVRDLADQFRRAAKVLVFVTPCLTAAFRQNEEAVIGLGFLVVTEDACGVGACQHSGGTFCDCPCGSFWGEGMWTIPLINSARTWAGIAA